MNFNAVISGSALNPNEAPPIMQSVIREVNNRTVEDLLQAISINSLQSAWKVEGGWSFWFYAICKGIVQAVGKFLNNNSGSSVPEYEQRLIEYFESQGYDADKALEMAKHIVSEVKS